MLALPGNVSRIKSKNECKSRAYVCKTQHWMVQDRFVCVCPFILYGEASETDNDEHIANAYWSHERRGDDKYIKNKT